MVPMMIFVEQNEFVVQKGFHHVHHGPVQPGGVLQQVYVLSPLFFTKFLKLLMQSQRTTAAIRQEGFEVLEARGHITRSKSMVRELVPDPCTRIQLELRMPHDFSPRFGSCEQTS